MQEERENLAARLLEEVDCGTVYLDAGGKVLFVNRRAEEILHVERAKVLGKRVDMLPLRTPIYRVLSENAQDEPVEVSIDGSVIQVRSSALGTAEGELFQLRDISSDKKEKRQREEFVAMMTHDLKSPLTVIMGYMQALMGEMPSKMDPSLHLFVKEMDKSAVKMLSMIDDVLDAYRLEAGLLQIDRQPCDARALLEGCCRDGEQEAAVHGSYFLSDICDGIPTLDLDEKQITRVFANLIGNAVKFTPRRGTISVTGTIEDDCLLVRVSDTGIGIPEGELPRIFNKYFRASGAQGFKGTGLGLTISKAIVEAHGGSIRVESSAGKGSCFSVLLPLAKERCSFKS
ncbi:PAS domain-containing sensor histidine kinase [Geomonas sp. Red69]|uniref:sensor histidine kinase n=1 Tax=Geomonas diazotrophica TaxID=2843197 RepID=UPI001C119CBC|nr:PAS domain-containing sensor histidine kinase [Geomonas diazotrophica]MBU5638593.1 PAS domain-containing sensor histidine kinase [Geomonas diazotrophica]